MNNLFEFPIVGVGVAAGGIEALEALLRGIVGQPGVALFIITHLSPESDGMLPEIVGRYTDLPVQICRHDGELENNTVYVMPPNSFLGFENRRVRLGKASGRRESKPIDVFLSALAMDIGEMAGGIILSGGDADGTLGIKAIKERGGITFARGSDGFGVPDPDLPEAAISCGLIDFVIPAGEMGAKLAEFARGEALFEELANLGAAGEERPVEEVVPEIYALLRDRIGHDFSGYKSRSFMRRVHRRMQVTQIASLDGYLERLREESEEAGALFRDLLINVTNFFRDEDAFETLATQVLPRLFEGRGAGDTVRIWVPGCATGEEVYSIGILVREHMEGRANVPRVQIFATDIDERALGVARAARYPVALLDSVSPERRARYFVQDVSTFVVAKAVRELCIFSPHSVLKDPPFSRVDMVSCRNLLIYFAAEAQNLVFPIFHYALRPQGYLFLGSAEDASQFDALFEPIDKQHKIFMRRSNVENPDHAPVLWHELRPSPADLAPRRVSLAGMAMRQAVEEQVLERFAPPHVVVNQSGEVVYFSARTGKYLEAPVGVPSRLLMTMARKPLRLDLRALFREAVETKRTVVREGIALETDGERAQFVAIMIEPLGDRAAGEPLFLVLFTDQVAAPRREMFGGDPALLEGATADSEREWRDTQQRLQSTIVEYEKVLVELKSSNLELVSVNEETRSANEELEVFKEELQSVNEELHAVNSELNGKIGALDRANSDLRNLFESTDVATIFLDSHLAIRSFTPAVAKIFNVRPSDAGRPITDLSSRFDLASLDGDIRQVFASGKTLEKRAGPAGGAAHYLVRVAAYRDGGTVDGVVISFIDISSLMRSEARQQVLIGELQHRTRNLLAVVQSLVRRTLGKGDAVEEFNARLAALGRVQSLVGGSLHERIDLGKIIRQELEAIGASGRNVSTSGPAVALDFEHMQTLGLALHELATNALAHGALKYGGIGDKTGKLAVSWEIRNEGQDDALLVIDWRESGVAGLEPPTYRGFGTELIERSLRFTLRAEPVLTFSSNGVSCHIELPLPAQGKYEGEDEL